MKKIIIFTITAIILFSASPVLAAWDSGINFWGKTVDGTGQADGKKLESNLAVVIGNIIKAVTALVGTIFLVLTVYAGILWMTASGKEDQLQKAQGIFINSVVGLLIVFSAYAITALITSKLKSSSQTDGCCYRKSSYPGIADSVVGGVTYDTCVKANGEWTKGTCPPTN